MNFIYYVTLQIVEVSSFPVMVVDWEIISAFLFLLLGLVIITTSLKSRKVKKLEKQVEQLKQRLKKAKQK